MTFRVNQGYLHERLTGGMSMLRAMVLAGWGAVLCVGVADAQHDHRSPYAGQEGSEIPALTAQEVRDLKAGSGMGFARAAELNHYPGPRHALDLADSLRLTDEQRDAIEAIRAAMSARAVALGERIVDAERQLNLRFQHGHADSAAVRRATADIARLYGELRFAHLAAHLATVRVLDESQVAAYDRLRGYAGP